MRFLRSRLPTNFAHTIPLEFGADANWIQLRKLIPPYPPFRDVRRGDQNGALANNSTLRRVEILIMDRREILIVEEWIGGNDRIESLIEYHHYHHHHFG